VNRDDDKGDADQALWVAFMMEYHDIIASDGRGVADIVLVNL
jgi:hypothetical protein